MSWRDKLTRIRGLEMRLAPDPIITVHVVKRDRSGKRVDYFTGEVLPDPLPGDRVIYVGRKEGYNESQ